MKRKEFRKTALAWMLVIAMVIPNSSMAVMAAEPDAYSTMDSTAELQENGDRENDAEKTTPTAGTDAGEAVSPETESGSEIESGSEMDETPEVLDTASPSPATEAENTQNTLQTSDGEHFCDENIQWGVYQAKISLKYIPANSEASSSDLSYSVQELNAAGEIIKTRSYSYMWKYDGKFQIDAYSYVLQKDTRQIQIVVTEKVDGNEVQFTSDLYDRPQDDSNPVFTVTPSACGAGTVRYDWRATGYNSSVGESFQVALYCTPSGAETVEKFNSIYLYSNNGLSGQMTFRDLAVNTTYQAEMEIYIEDIDGTRMFQQNIALPAFQTTEDTEYDFEKIIPDKALRTIIANRLSISDDTNKIKTSQLETLTSLYHTRLRDSQDAIKSLQGIEYLTNLENISIYNHEITEINDVSWEKMTKLENLSLIGNDIAEAVDLSKVNTLTYVNLEENKLSKEKIQQIKLPEGCKGNFDDQRVNGTSLITEPRYYQVDGKTTVFAKIKGIRSNQFENDITFEIDGNSYSYQQQYGGVYYVSQIDLAVGEHTLKITVNGEAETLGFSVVKKEEREFSTQYFASTWGSGSVSLKTTQSLNLVKAEMIDSTGKVYGTSSYVSSYSSNYEENYTTIGEGEGFNVGSEYTIYNHSISLDAYRSSTPAGTYDLKLIYGDKTEEIIKGIIQVVGKNIAVLQNIYSNAGYDNTQGYLYLVVYSSNLDPSRLQYVASDENGSHVLEYVSAKKTYSGYVVKLRQVDWIEAKTSRIKVTISAKDGYEAVLNKTEASVSIDSGAFYVRWNEVNGKVEVAVTQDVNVTKIQVELKQRQGSNSSKIASGETTSVNANYASVVLKDESGNVITSLLPGQYEIRVSLNDGSVSKTEYFSVYASSTVNAWSGSSKFIEGTKGNSFYYYTALEYEKYKNDKYEFVLLNAAGDEIKKVSAKVGSSDWVLFMYPSDDVFSSLKCGSYQLAAMHNQELLSKYAFEVIKEEKFLLSSQSAQWIAEEENTVQVYLGTPNVTSTDKLNVEMYDPYGNKVEGIHTSVLRKYASSVYLKITGIDKETAYRKYWIKVSHSDLGDPYLLDDTGKTFYSDEKGAFVSLYQAGSYFTQTNKKTSRFVANGWTYPITITAYLPYDTEAVATFTANSGGAYIGFPRSFVDQLPDPDRLYDLVAQDSNGNSVVSEKRVIGYDKSSTVKLTGITINPTAVKLAAGESVQIHVAPKPANAVLGTPTFQSSDEKIATVDSTGKISAVAKGQAKITVKVSGYTQTCAVTVADVVKAPKASETSGEVAKNTQITLTSETEGAVIYYTLDGTDPTVKSTKYTAPIQITRETTIRAIAAKSGYLDSEIAEFTYSIPVVQVIFDTDGGKPESEPQTLRKGDYLDMYHVSEPEKEGYRFEGWYVGDEKLDPTKAVMESMTVKARWSEAEKLSVPEANYPDGKSLPVGAEVVLTSEKGTDIYYTLDGSTPTRESHLYKEPVVLVKDLWKDGTVTIKMMTAGTGYRNSEVAVYQYHLTEDLAGYGEIEIRDIPKGEIPEGTWIAGLEEEYTYTGKAIKPEIRVYDYKRKLALNKDYSISYKNNTNAGEAQMIVTGKGNYTSKITQTFVIGAKSLEDGDITAADLAVAGNNKVQKKAPVVQWAGRKLAVNKDYTLSYEESDANSFKAPGKYRITITGKGNFTGSLTVVETITDAKSDKLLEKMKFSSVKAQTYTGEEICPEITVTDKKTVLIKGTDYEVEYRNNVAVGTATIVLRGLGDYKGEKQIPFKINGTAMNKVAINGIKNLTYEVGRNVYEQEDLQLTFKKSKTETITLPEDAYEVSYANNTKAGTATVIFTGIPEKGYTGSVKKTFKILANDSISEAEILYAQEVSYSKGGAKPSVTVRMGDVELIPDVDYTVSYKNNAKLHDGKAKNAPTISIKGKGNYKGQVVRTFAIVAKDIGGLTATAEDVVFSNKKNNYIAKVTIMDTDGKKLSAGTDYDKNLTYYEGERKIEKNEILPVGTEITVKINGKGNYQGEIRTVYRIGEKKFGSVKVTIPSQEYTGEEVTLEKKDLTITYKEGKETKTLTEAEFEIVGYENNVKKGTAKVTIKGLGAYAGTKTVTFKIVAKPIKK